MVKIACIQSGFRTLLVGRGPGRPPKLGLAETALLAVVREHRRMTYRELAASRYARRLGLRVHYTAIQKAIARLPEHFLNEAARVYAELVSGESMDAVADATEFSLSARETRRVVMEQRPVKRTVKLSALWDADKRVFHGACGLPGKAHEVNTLLPIVDSVRVRIRNLLADCGYAPRANVQGLADRGIEPVIRPPSNATLNRGLKCPAWRKLVERYHELGYERWRDKTGYGKRFENEGAFGALITRFGDAVRARNPKIALRLLGARLVLHNFFASLVQC
jgi:transposase